MNGPAMKRLSLPRFDPAQIKERLLEGDLSNVMQRYSDILLAMLVMAILAIMIVPMPPWMLDLFLAGGITLSVSVLMIALYVPNALALAAFPTILLVATLLRLSLNVSSTRLILLDGYAGEVIRAFGQFVVQGNFVVGFVIFLIITIIQFVVIAKGAERVSEVAARFTLDALPGKQMSIDADLRAGIIDAEEAKRRRDMLGRESQFYGAMDGAMKFVKGDTIASIIISLINIIAGLGIGMLGKDLIFIDAAKKYTLLTVGDGLVSQIPSLIMATAAAIITTRVASAAGEESSLGQDIGMQVLSQPKAIAIASGLLFVLGLVPGLPFVPFTVLALAAAGFSWGVLRTQQRKDSDAIRAEVMGDDSNKQEEEQNRLPVTVPVMLETSPQVTPLVDVKAHGSRFIQELLPQMRSWLFSELGVNLPGVRVRGEAAYLQKNSYVIYINEVPVATGFAPPDRVFVSQNLQHLAMLGIEGMKGATPDGQGTGLWIRAEDADRVPNLAGTLRKPDEYLSVHLATVLRRKVDQLLGVKDVQQMLTALEQQGYGPLIKSVVPDLVTPQRLTDILRRLLRENISIRNMPAILEALAEWASFENDPVYLTEYVRGGLKPYIAHRFGKGQPILSVVVVDPRIEQILRDGIHQSTTGSTLSLEPEASKKILEAFAGVLGQGRSPGAGTPLVLTQSDVRYFLKQLLEPQHPDLSVLSYQELPSELQIRAQGRVMLPGNALDKEASDAA